MNDIDRDPFGNKLNHNHSVILPPLYSDLLDRAPFGKNQITMNEFEWDPFGQIKSS